MDNIPVFINVKQVAHIIGKGERSAQLLINEICKVFVKRKVKMVMVKEFCEYMCINVMDIKEVLLDPRFR